MVVSTDLSSDVRHRLGALIDQDRVGERTFRAAGDSLHEADLTAMCYGLAHQHRDFAEELERVIGQRHHEPLPGSRAQHLRRWWQAMRTRLTLGERVAVLHALERIERRTRCQYDDTMRRTPRPELRRLLHRHHRSIRDSHKRLRTLRRRYAGGSA